MVLLAAGKNQDSALNDNGEDGMTRAGKLGITRETKQW